MIKYRQFFKYLLFTIHLLFPIIFTKLSTDKGFHFVFFVTLIILYFAYSIILLVGYNKFTFRNYLLKPKLPKRVVHESGEYFIKYFINEKKYVIYKDNIFNLEMLFELDNWRVEDSKTLQKEVKSKLDEIYHEKMAKLNSINKRLKILEEWDGYTSIQNKRDDKIKQVIN